VSEQRLTCADCGREFAFSAEEQRFFREKGFEPPKRCKECRQAKKAQRGDDARGGGGRR
jgi:DNA replicative helicase MCM subunit Mcm2 (Cdc46/Mcm family)